MNHLRDLIQATTEVMLVNASHQGKEGECKGSDIKHFHFQKC